MLNETWGNHGKEPAKLSSRRLVLSWKSVWHSQSRQRLGRQWTALNLLSTWANRRALSTSSSRQSILGRYAPLFSCSKYVHFYGRLTVYSLYSSPYTPSELSCFIDTLLASPKSLQCLLASSRHQPSLGCGRKSAQISRQRSEATDSQKLSRPSFMMQTMQPVMATRHHQHPTANVAEKVLRRAEVAKVRSD